MGGRFYTHPINTLIPLTVNMRICLLLMVPLFLLGCRPDNRRERLDAAVESLVKEQSEAIKQEAEDLAAAIVAGKSIETKEPNRDQRCADLCKLAKQYKPQLDSIQLLLEEGLDPNCNCTVYSSSKRFGARIPIVKDFMKRKYNTTSSKKTPLNMAILDESKELVQLYLDYGAAANAKIGKANFPLDEALSADNQALIDLLINAGANPALADLHCAKSEAVIDQFIAAGCDPANINVEIALNQRDAPLLRRLMRKGAKLQQIDHFHLIRFQKASILKILLEEGMDPDIPNYSKDGSLLMEAIAAGEKEKVQLLLEAGADPNIRGNFDKTTVQLVVTQKNPALLRQLIEAGANVNPDSISIFYKNPMELAIKKGDLETVQTMQAAGAKVRLVKGSNQDFAISVDADSTYSSSTSIILLLNSKDLILFLTKAVIFHGQLRLIL